MDTNASPLIGILDSLASDWEYAPLIREKIESGDISWDEISEFTRIFWNGMRNLDNENSNIEMRNMLFRKFLMQTEEMGTRKSENANVDTLLEDI